MSGEPTKEITLTLRPIGDGSTYEIWSTSHPHLKIIQRPPYAATVYEGALNAAQFAQVRL